MLNEHFVILGAFLSLIDAHWGFPLYIFTTCLLLFVLIRFKIGKFAKKS